MLRTESLVLLLVIAVAGSARVARAEVVALATLERLALRQRPALEVGAARVREAQAEIDKASSAYRPRVTLEAETVLAPGGTLATVRDVDGHEFLVGSPRRADDPRSGFVPQIRGELGIDVKSTLYDFGRTRAALRASGALRAAAEAEQEAGRQALVQAVRGAYLGWLGASELAVIAEQASQEAQRRTARVRDLIAEGMRPQAELSVARADEILARLELERAQAALRAGKLALEQVVGTALPAAAEPDRALLDAGASGLRQPGDGDGEERVLQLQSQAAGINALAQAKLDAPVLGGALSAGVRSQDQRVFPNYSVGLRFSLPLWDGGTTSASAAGAAAQAARAAAILQQHREQRRGALERARLDAQTADVHLQTAGELLEIATERVRETEQAYELGASNLDALAQARALLRRAQTEALLARVARAEAALR